MNDFEVILEEAFDTVESGVDVSSFLIVQIDESRLQRGVESGMGNLASELSGFGL